MGLLSQRTVLAFVLIAVGVALLLPEIRIGWIILVAIGAYLVYVWSRRRQMGHASPWLLAIGAVMVLEGLERFHRFNVPFLPTLLIIAGLAYLLDARSQ